MQPITEYYNSRISGIINANIEDASEIVKSFEAKYHYDEFFKGAEVIRAINPDLKLIHITYKGWWPFFNERDMVILCVCEKIKDGRIIVAGKSIKHKDYPVFSKIVRSDLKIGSWILE